MLFRSGTTNNLVDLEETNVEKSALSKRINKIQQKEIRDIVNGIDYSIFQEYERIMKKVDWKAFHAKFKNILTGQPNYIEAPNNDFPNEINKACFSSEMVEKLLRLYGANKKSLVLDNFMGTGTTAIGCEKIGCSSVGIELDTLTYDFSRERVREFIGEFENLKEYNLFNSFDEEDL